MTTPIAPPAARFSPWAGPIAGVAIAIAVFAGAAAIVAGVDLPRALDWLDRAGGHVWAAPLSIVAFVILASLGAPQIVLVTTLVAVFGPWAGYVYSLVGKTLSCAIGFLIGRRFGAAPVQRRAGAKLRRVMNALARHGFLASALIRLAPTLPSVAVNVAAGCTPMRFSHFIAGAILGSAPKLALIAFAGHSAIAGLKGAGPHAWLSLLAAGAVLVAVSLVARRWIDGRLSAAE